MPDCEAPPGTAGTARAPRQAASTPTRPARARHARPARAGRPRPTTQSHPEHHSDNDSDVATKVMKGQFMPGLCRQTSRGRVSRNGLSRAARTPPHATQTRQGLSRIGLTLQCRCAQVLHEREGHAGRRGAGRVGEVARRKEEPHQREFTMRLRVIGGAGWSPSRALAGPGGGARQAQDGNRGPGGPWRGAVLARRLPRLRGPGQGVGEGARRKGSKENREREAACDNVRTTQQAPRQARSAPPQ